MPDNVRDNLDAEGFGYRWDDLQNKFAIASEQWNNVTLPGLDAGTSKTVCFKLMTGLTSQSKLIPIKFAPLTIELEIVNNPDDAIITPDKKTLTS